MARPGIRGGALRVVALRPFLDQMLYEAALMPKECEGRRTHDVVELVRDCCWSVVEYSLRQLYRDYCGFEWGSQSCPRHTELTMCLAIGFPAWVEYEDRKPKVKPCVDKLIEILSEDAGRDHVIVLAINAE